jgi:mono/diheme cytochrome c family protein
MNKNKLYSVSALFDTPNSIINAAKTVANEGYKNYDVHTPYPVHGMDNAMKLKPSKIGYITISIGLTFLSLMAWFIYWVTSIDYPQVIGGKPFYAVPAFIPVFFETTILTGAVGSVIAMIIFFFKFPNNSHPLHDTDYMKAVSSDQYGVTIESIDEKFDVDHVTSLFKSLGATKIEEVYFEEEFGKKFEIFDKKFLALLAVLVLFVSGSAYMHLNKLLYIPPFNWMMEQPKANAQSTSKFFKDGSNMLQPVEGTVAKGFMPYAYHGKPEEAEVKLINPLEANDKTLAKGKERFLTYCSPCHGNHADGASRLRGQFPNGPTMHSDKVVNWTDGRIYHVISDGQNVMPAYNKQILPEDRWAIVLYIRTLQRAYNAKEGDLK